MSITLQDCMDAMIKTKAVGATPHRDLNWEEVVERVGLKAPIKGVVMFMEEHNTGYDGWLERWMMQAADKDGKPLTLWLDLLPGMFTSEESS